MAIYRYVKNKKEYGPINSHQLKQKASNGELQPNDLVRQEGSKKYMRASEIAGLKFKLVVAKKAPSVIRSAKPVKPVNSDAGVIKKQKVEPLYPLWYPTLFWTNVGMVGTYWLVCFYYCMVKASEGAVVGFIWASVPPVALVTLSWLSQKNYKQQVFLIMSNVFNLFLGFVVLRLTFGKGAELDRLFVFGLMFYFMTIIAPCVYFVVWCLLGVFFKNETLRN